MSEAKKILIVGGTGFVGSNLTKVLSRTHSVSCTYREEFTRFKGVDYFSFPQLGEKDRCKALLDEIEPEVIIYCVGSNDPKIGEVDSRKTQYLHCTGAKQLISASESKAKFIYISSSWIFSGIDGNFSETDVAIPAFQLGKAKLGAENYIRSRSTNYVIIRPAPLLGRGTVDHPSWTDLLRENDLRKKKSILSQSNLHNPVHISVLTDLVNRVIDQGVKNKTFHLGGLTKISLFEAAQIFLKEFGFDSSLLKSADADVHAEPADYSLNFSQTLKTFQFPGKTFPQCLQELK